MGPQQLLSILSILLLCNIATAFSAFGHNRVSSSLPQTKVGLQYLVRWHRPVALYAASQEHDEEEDDDGNYEDLYNELMGQRNKKDSFPSKKRPPSNNNNNKKQPSGKQKSIKKPHDNRDNLPFLVQVLTPPEQPYEQLVQKKVKKKAKRKRRKIKGAKDWEQASEEEDDRVVGETLGEFKFEKNTGSGDKIEIDNQIYLVTRAKCQYRYAGAQRFEMVRKILQVKPVQRAMQEEYILRQFNAPSARESE